MKAKQEFNKDIDSYLIKLEKRRIKVYMCDTKGEEANYVLHNEDRYFEALKEFKKIIKKKGDKIFALDIGTSPLTFILKSRYKNVKLDTIDISDNFAKLSKINRVGFRKVDLNKKSSKLPKNKYDIVLFLEVLEHLSGNHKNALKKIIGSLKKGGVCIIQTPNKYSPKAVFTAIFSMKFWDLFSKRPELNPEFAHHKEYSLGELANLLNTFKDIKINTAENSIYFDTTASSMVYRNKNSWIYYLMKLNFEITNSFPFLRRGMQMVITKR